MHQHVINKFLLVSKKDVQKRQPRAGTKTGEEQQGTQLSIGQDDRHRVRIAPEQVGRHDQRHVRRRHLGRALHALVQKELQEADDEEHHAAVDRRQTRDDLHALVRFPRGDALVVRLLRDQRVAQLAQPELQQRRQHMWVVHAVEGVVPPVDPQLQVRHGVAVTRHPEDALRLCAAQRKDAVGQEGKDDGHLLVGIIALLQPNRSVQRFSKGRGIERGVLDTKINDDRRTPSTRSLTCAVSISANDGGFPRGPF